MLLTWLYKCLKLKSNFSVRKVFRGYDCRDSNDSDFPVSNSDNNNGDDI